VAGSSAGSARVTNGRAQDGQPGERQRGVRLRPRRSSTWRTVRSTR